MSIGNRDTSLLSVSMACLALAINCTRIRGCLLAGQPRRQGPLLACEGQANVQSELDGVTRNRSIYARTFFPWRLSVLCVFYIIVEKPTTTPAVQQLDEETQIVETRLYYLWWNCHFSLEQQRMQDSHTTFVGGE